MTTFIVGACVGQIYQLLDVSHVLCNVQQAVHYLILATAHVQQSLHQGCLPMGLIWGFKGSISRYLNFLHIITEMSHTLQFVCQGHKKSNHKLSAIMVCHIRPLEWIVTYQTLPNWYFREHFLHYFLDKIIKSSLATRITN